MTKSLVTFIISRCIVYNKPVTNPATNTMQVTHTIDADTEETFTTAADCNVSIYSRDDDGTLSVKLIPKDGRDSEKWDWAHDQVVRHLIDGNLIPENGEATDFLRTE